MEEAFTCVKDCKVLSTLSFLNYIIHCWELHTYFTISLLRSVGSRQILRELLGFFTITNEFNHSGLMFLPSNLEIIPCASILYSSFLNFSLIARGTFLGGFCIGTPFCQVVVCTGVYLNLPIPVKR